MSKFTDFEAFKNNEFQTFKRQLKYCSEEMRVLQDVTKQLFFSLVREVKHYEKMTAGDSMDFDIPYERCAFCHVDGLTDKTQRIVRVSIDNNDVYLCIEDKDNPERFERNTVRIFETDYDYAHLMQLLIDYIEN